MPGQAERAAVGGNQADIDALTARLGHEEPTKNAEYIARSAQEAVAAAAEKLGIKMTPELAGIASAQVALKACGEAGEFRGDLHNLAIPESLFDASLAHITVGRTEEAISRREAAQNA